MSIIKKLNLKKGDVVKVKFKDLKTIVEYYNQSLPHLLDILELNEHVNAILMGHGIFLVQQGMPYDYESRPIDGHKVKVDNPHCSSDSYRDDFFIYDSIIESMEIVQPSAAFMSSTFNLSVVRIEDTLYINGEPVSYDKKEDKDKDEDGASSDCTLLFNIIENYIADMAVKQALGG